MEYRQVGEHGLTLSSLGLGTRTWGLDTDSHEATEMLQAFIDAGGTFVQVESDPRYYQPLDVLGQCLASNLPRSAIKIGLRSGTLPGESDLAPAHGRGALLDSLDQALRAMGTDHVDLWVLSGPLPNVPLAESLSALEGAYQSGRARYVGIGNLSWWAGGTASAISTTQGWPLAAWEDEVSLLRPRVLSSGADELCRSGMGIVAAAPLAGGLLTGKYRHATPPDARAASPRFRPEIEKHLRREHTIGVVDAVVRAAEGLDHTAAQVALAWARSVPQVATAVVGPRTTRQLDHLLEIADWRLPPALFDVLAEVALPH